MPWLCRPPSNVPGTQLSRGTLVRTRNGSGDCLGLATCAPGAICSWTRLPGTSRHVISVTDSGTLCGHCVSCCPLVTGAWPGLAQTWSLPLGRAHTQALSVPAGCGSGGSAVPPLLARGHTVLLLPALAFASVSGEQTQGRSAALLLLGMVGPQRLPLPCRPFMGRQLNPAGRKHVRLAQPGLGVAHCVHAPELVDRARKRPAQV